MSIDVEETGGGSTSPSANGLTHELMTRHRIGVDLGGILGGDVWREVGIGGGFLYRRKGGGCQHLLIVAVTVT